MYINTNYIKKIDLTFAQAFALQVLFQNTSGKEEETLKELGKPILNSLYSVGYVKLVKKGDSAYHKARLSDKGKTVYRKMTQYVVDETDEVIYEFLSNAFKQLEKKQGSKNKVLKMISFFRIESGLSHGNLYKLCKAYINDEDQMEYSHLLENIFFKGSNVYEKPNLGNSRLWNYYNNNIKK